MNSSFIALALALILVADPAAAVNLADYQPMAGPMTADLGQDLATVNVGPEHFFVDAPHTRKLLEALGNPTDGRELGIILPQEDGRWFIVFEYRETGWVPDKDSKSLNAAALFASIRKNTEASNAQRKAAGHSTLHLKAWVEEPHYDQASKRLVWALSATAEGENREVVNYNTRILGRHGLISVTMVTDHETFAQAKALVPGVISGVSFKPGKRYEEFVRGQDRVAEYGLAALVAGGAGVAAVKAAQSGLLARFWKAIVLGVLAAAGALWKLLGGRRRATA